MLCFLNSHHYNSINYVVTRSTECYIFVVRPKLLTQSPNPKENSHSGSRKLGSATSSLQAAIARNKEINFRHQTLILLRQESERRGLNRKNIHVYLRGILKSPYDKTKKLKFLQLLIRGEVS